MDEEQQRRAARDEEFFSNIRACLEFGSWPPSVQDFMTFREDQIHKTLEQAQITTPGSHTENNRALSR